MRVGIIGATGWLGSALGGQLLARGMLGPAELVLLNRSGPGTDYHGHADVTWARDVDELVACSDIVDRHPNGPRRACAARVETALAVGTRA